jgi:hypothetical protein
VALPKAYLTSVKNLPSIFDAIRQAKAPERFTQRFLESLEFKSNSDRLIIGVLKALAFLDDQGKPTDRYFRFLDQTQSDVVMAEAVREAYDDLFQVNTSAHNLSKQDVVNKFKTLSQGQFSESVLDKMAMTFTALVKLADFKAPSARPAATAPPKADDEVDTVRQQESEVVEPRREGRAPLSLGGLHYNIQIIMPESRDPKVYDALFRSLREHLL